MSANPSARLATDYHLPRPLINSGVDCGRIVADQVGMVSKHITLADPVAEVIEAQIGSGRYKDVSAALNDAAWHHFIGLPSPFVEYGVTAKEVERSADRDLSQIQRDRKAGKLIPL